MSERLFNPGYVAFAVEVTPGVPLIPTDFGQAYDFGIELNRNNEELAPAAGNAFGTQQVVAGLRDHKGDGTFIFEPNTFEKIVAMMLAQTSRTGAGPYTGVYGYSAANPPGKTYTIEASDGIQAIRHFGCQVSKLTPTVKGNEIQMKPSFSALGTFDGREIASVSGSGPYVLTLKTDYDPTPTNGLVVGDIMQWVTAAGVVLNFTISAVTATTVSTVTNVAAAVSGDWIRLRALTPTFNLLPPVLWSNTQFCFGATASAALAATQVRVEPGSMWEMDFEFKDDKGEHRSGGQDPAALLRKPGKAMLTIKKFFDTQSDMLNFNSLAKTACVIRHFVYSGASTYEVRVTLNRLTTGSPIPKWKAGEINYSEIKYLCSFDSGDGQGASITVIGSNSALT